MLGSRLQKSAHIYRELQGAHKGILNPQRFASAIDLKCYEPSSDMAPFILHYFIARRTTGSKTSFTATDILTGPVNYLFFTPQAATIFGAIGHMRTITVAPGGLYAGVKFRPGAFHAFWKDDVSHLTEAPATDVFSKADTAFTTTLLTHDDQELLATLELLMREAHPQWDERIADVGRIVGAITERDDLPTTQSVANAFNMSERALQKLFTTYVGVGVKWVIMRARLLRAIHHAHHPTNINWTTIAADLGYSTQSHFVNDFKKVIGVSPAAYARAITN